MTGVDSHIITSRITLGSTAISDTRSTVLSRYSARNLACTAADYYPLG